MMLARESGLPVFRFDEHNQTGSTFASRYTWAIQSVFDAGFDRLITIGNDCPQLNVTQIRQAASLIEEGEAVLGPTVDGGFYLLGLTKKDFNPEAFLGFSWNTDTVFEELSTHLSVNKVSCKLLRKLADVDHMATLESLDLKMISDVRLRCLIRSVLRVSGWSVRNLSINISQPVISNPHNKGSPLAFFQIFSA